MACETSQTCCSWYFRRGPPTSQWGKRSSLHESLHVSVLTTSFAQQFRKSPLPSPVKVAAKRCIADDPWLESVCSTMLFRHMMCPKEASFPSKCGHSTIPFHHSIPVEHSTDSIPPWFARLLVGQSLLPPLRQEEKTGGSGRATIR